MRIEMNRQERERAEGCYQPPEPCPDCTLVSTKCEAVPTVFEVRSLPYSSGDGVHLFSGMNPNLPQPSPIPARAARSLSLAFAGSMLVLLWGCASEPESHVVSAPPPAAPAPATTTTTTTTSPSTVVSNNGGVITATPVPGT